MYALVFHVPGTLLADICALHVLVILVILSFVIEFHHSSSSTWNVLFIFLLSYK